jgi:hypothetical protein
VTEWAREQGKGHAFVHILRKTTLQHARRREDINRLVAGDARVSEAVMMTSYVKETDEEMRQKSNRTFHRFLAALPTELARRYGHLQQRAAPFEAQLQAAMEAGNRRAKGTHIGKQNGPTWVQGYTGRGGLS